MHSQLPVVAVGIHARIAIEHPINRLTNSYSGSGRATVKLTGTSLAETKHPVHPHAVTSALPWDPAVGDAAPSSGMQSAEGFCWRERSPGKRGADLRKSAP